MEFKPRTIDRQRYRQLESFWQARQSHTTPSYREFERQRAALDALLDVSRELGATTELIPLLRKVERSLCDVLNCERAAIFLYDRPTDELYSLVATGEELISFSAKLGIAGEAFQTCTMLNIADAYADCRFNREIDKLTGLHTRNILASPMRSYDGNVVGVIEALNKRAGSFDNNDEKHATDLGILAGVAIQRQMLLEAYSKKLQMERDLSLARDIQRKLVPKADPQVAGYQISGWNKPAAETGGDFYDYVPVQDHCLGILLTDVMGHGIGPALIVSECRALVRALALNSCDPVQILRQVNRMLCEDLDCGQFVTTFFGILDPKEHCLSYLSTGQGPLLHFVKKTGKCQVIPATTFPLGISPDFEQKASERISLQNGDLLVLVTDGFFEWPNPEGELFGFDRLISLIRKYCKLTPGEIIHQFYQGVVKYASGVSQPDDLTAVILKRV